MDTDAKKFFEGLASGNSSFNNKDQEVEVVSVAEPVSEGDIADEREGQLTIDVYQTPSTIIVESPIAGVKNEDLEVEIASDSVTIKGKRERIDEVKDEDYLYQECYWGRFSRSVILPQEIEPDKSEASVKNGLLRIVMPKLSRQKSKKIKIKID